MRVLCFRSIRTVGLAVLAAGAGCSRQLVITQPFNVASEAPLILNVAPIGLALPLDTRESAKPRPEELLRLQQLIHAELMRASLTTAPDDRGRSVTYEVQGSIVAFKRGNGLVRFFGAFGLGTARTIAHLRIVELSTGQVVFAGNFVGVVAGWSFGERALHQIARMFVGSFVREMQTNRRGSAAARGG